MTRFDRVEVFQATLKELEVAPWLSQEANDWLAVLNDPDRNSAVMKALDELLARCHAVWNEETQSFCQVPAVFDALSQCFRIPKARPKIRLFGRNINASRAVFVTGHCFPIGDGTLVRHLCDNPLCLEVDHLIEGTYLENSLDKLK